MKNFKQYLEQISINESSMQDTPPNLARLVKEYVESEKHNLPLFHYFSTNPAELDQFVRLYKNAVNLLDRKTRNRMSKTLSSSEPFAFLNFNIDFVIPKMIEQYIASSYHLDEEAQEKIIRDWEIAYGEDRSELEDK